VEEPRHDYANLHIVGSTFLVAVFGIEAAHFSAFVKVGRGYLLDNHNGSVTEQIHSYCPKGFP